jgi:hypothetical protein
MLEKRFQKKQGSLQKQTKIASWHLTPKSSKLRETQHVMRWSPNGGLFPQRGALPRRDGCAAD